MNDAITLLVGALAASAGGHAAVQKLLHSLPSGFAMPIVCPELIQIYNEAWRNVLGLAGH